METLAIPAFLVDQLREHGRCALPREAVGLLYGRDALDGARLIDRFVPLTNSDEGAGRFQIDEIEFLNALRVHGEAPDAFFHTHPVEPAIPSSHDIRGAAGWPRALHVILSFGAREELRCWRIFDGQVIEEPHRIV